jgi:hypothetical protein
MRIINNIRCEGVHVALTLALLAASAVNLTLVYAWL